MLENSFFSSNIFEVMGPATLDANCCDFVVGTREVKPEMCKSSSVGTGKKEADRNVSLLKNQMFVRLLFKINRNCYQNNVFFLFVEVPILISNFI